MSRRLHAPQLAPWSAKRRSRILKRAGRAGLETAILSGATAAVTAEPLTTTTIAAVGFIGGATILVAGECVNYWKDDPSPAFGDDTVFLFDTAGLIICFLLFVLPACALDLSLIDTEPGTGAALPGALGFLALFLSVFLVTILRGLLVNLGVVRHVDDDVLEN